MLSEFGVVEGVLATKVLSFGFEDLQRNRALNSAFENVN